MNSKSSSVPWWSALGFGKAAPGAIYPAIYAYAAVGGVRGVYQSIDEGATWTRIDDNQHRYGGLANGALLIGDMNTFGVVYMSTAGRGIAARLPGASTDPTSVARGTLAGKASLRGGVLRLALGEATATVTVRALDGRVLARRDVRGDAVVSLASLGSSHGMALVEVRSSGKVLLSAKTSLIR